MAKDLELALRIRADLKQAVDALRRFKSEFSGVGKQGQRTGKDLDAAFSAIGIRSFRDIKREIQLTQAAYKRLSDSGRLSARELNVAHRQMTLRVKELRAELKGGTADGSRFGKAFAGLVSVYAGMRLAGAVVQITDQYTLLEGRLRLVTDSEAELASVEQELFNAAQRTRTAYASTAELYARVARNAEHLNLSQQRLLELTEATNQAIQISGSGPQEAAAGVLQFAQALASDELRGDELRSVMENMPRLAQAIADGLETDIGGLRRMAEAGELTADRVTEALLSQKDILNREYGNLGRTVGQAMVQLRNDIEQAVADTDMSPVIDAIDDLREMVKDPAFREGITELLSATVQIAALAGKAAAGLGNIGKSIGVESAKMVSGRYSLEPFAQEIQDTGIELKRLERQLETSSGGGLLQRWLYGSREELEQKIEATRRRLEELRRWQAEMTPGVAAVAPEATTTKPGKSPAGPSTDFLEAQADLDKRITLLGRESMEQKLLWETQNGRYKDLAQGEKDALIAQAARLDAAQADARQAEENRRTARAVRDTLDPLQSLRSEMAQLDTLLDAGKISWDEWAEATLNVQERMDGLNGKLNETGTQVDQFAVQAARNLQSTFSAILFDPFEEGLQGMLRGFIDMIRQMTAEALAAAALRQLLGLAGGLGGGIGAAATQLAANVKHGGGMAGTGQMRQVSPLLFAGAPRYHSGGIAGLAPDEVPAILRRNEEVLTDNDPRHRDNLGGAGGGQAQSMRFVLVDDRSNIGDYMASSEGEKVQIETIRRNAMTIRNIIGG